MPPVHFSSIYRDFLAHKRHVLKPRSVKTYEEAFRRIEAVWGAGPPGSIDSFIAAERARNISTGAINVRLRSLKACLRWAAEEGRIKEAPRVRLLRSVRRLGGKAVGREQLDKAMRLSAPRERALIVVLAAGGLRIDEALHLQWQDVEGDRLRIAARDGWSPKSHQERDVMLSDTALSELEAYRATLRRASPTDWIFQGRRGHRLQDVPKIIRSIFRAAGIYQKGRLTHELRRGAANAWRTSGVDVETIRELLGHESIVTTERYFRSDEGVKRQAAKKGLI